MSGAIMAHQAPLKYVFYIASPPEKVWEGFVSRESNRIIFSGAEFQADFKPGGALAWVGAGPDGKPVTYVRGKVLRFEPISTHSKWVKMIRHHAQLSNLSPRPKPPK
jgi:uncharacterized protein YndB with AHSA1/START domain